MRNNLFKHSGYQTIYYYNQAQFLNNFSMEPSQKKVSELIPPAELNTYQELFSFFDKEDTGSIPMTSVAMYIRGVGYCPTQAELGKILEGFGAPNKKQVAFHELMQFLAKNPKEQQIEQKLIDAFNTLNSNQEGDKRQLMPTNIFKKLLYESGERLSDCQLRELTEFLNSKDLRTSEQQFNYRNFCKILAYSQMEI